jgi:tRNA(fMet)-specific endonuclease VapC
MSLYVLDTDILSLYQRGHPEVCRRVSSHPLVELAITVITVEEQISGWYTLLRRATKRDQIALAYRRLAITIPFLARWAILEFPEPAIQRYEDLLTMKLNIKKMDLRLAAITLESMGILVTRNLRDFQRIPGLTIEDWSA